MELMRAMDIFINKIKKDYKEDVACVVVMGSYVYNETHSRSDLDMYFVPKTERGYNLSKVCVIEGIGFDFWPISWDRLERMARHEEKITSIITDGKLMYYGNEEDLKKFNALKDVAVDVSDQKKFIKKAQDKLNEVYKPYYQLFHCDNLSRVRLYSIDILMSITHAVSLLNRTTVKRGRGKLKSEIMEMSLVPENFSGLYDKVFVSEDMGDIKDAYRQLINNTATLIEYERSRVVGPASFKDNVTGLYEEMINCYNKIHRAYDIGDYYTALIVACELELELSHAFEGTIVSIGQLPDIVAEFSSKDMKAFMMMVEEHQRLLESILEEHGVEVCRFENFDDLEEYYQSI